MTNKATAEAAKSVRETAIKEINRLHNLIVQADASTLEYAIEAGDLLHNLKKTVQHGDWLPFLKEHFPSISERTAQDYMWAYNKRTQIEAQQKKSAGDGDQPNPQRAALLTSIRGAKEALKQPGSSKGSTKKAKTAAAKSAASPDLTKLLKNVGADEVVKAILDAHGSETDYIKDLQQRLSDHLAKKAKPVAKPPTEALTTAVKRSLTSDGLGRTAVPSNNI